MSIIKLNSENFQTYRLIANPRKVFHSKSDSGVTGSIKLFTDESPRLKGPVGLTLGQAGDHFNDNILESSRALVFAEGKGSFLGLQGYMTGVNSKPQGKSLQKRQEVLRFIPGARLDKNHGRKNVIRKVLMDHYAYKYQSLEWAYTNYNTLNFFRSSTTPSDTVLIYPAGTGSVEDENLNYYAPSSSFTFDFYIKPKVNLNQTPDEDFHAGTIMHMSSCYAISLVTGSSKSVDGLPEGFRLLFQLSQSADIPPRLCKPNNTNVTAPLGDTGLLFATEDNSLKRDNWHHVTIRWPGSTVDGGSGSIDIDSVSKKSFIITSSSVMQSFQPTSAFDDPNAVFVGNYYEGKNTGTEVVARYFNEDVSLRQGLTVFTGSGNEDPSTAVLLRHPLSAEVHDLKIYNTHKSDDERDLLGTKGISNITSDLLFYVPPFFIQETRNRDILQTPFFDVSGSSEDPFNVALSFGVGGLEINLENFCREFVRKEYPRFFNLTSSRVDTTVFENGLTSNDILYSSGSSINRLYTILPCDNGLFTPNFEFLQTGSLQKKKFIDSYGAERFDLVYLGNMVSTDNLVDVLRTTDSIPERTFASGALSTPNLQADETLVSSAFGAFSHDLQGASPEDPSVDPGNILTILQRTGDPSSNEVIFFDISNLFYGDRILPNTLKIEDLDPTGIDKSFKFTLKDNGLGNIYRADTLTKQSERSSVGNVFYEDGIILVKTPHLGFFGKNEFKITFQGERSVYVFEVSIPIAENLHNSSSNPQYKSLKPTSNYNEIADRFTYVTGVQLHDNNLNIIGRANFAQPYIKREGDRVVVKLRMDY